jgi:hypothetical protein
MPHLKRIFPSDTFVHIIKGFKQIFKIRGIHDQTFMRILINPTIDIVC